MRHSIRENKYKNRIFTLIIEDTLKALANIEFTLISIQKMGSYYSDKPVKEYQKTTTELINDDLSLSDQSKIKKSSAKILPQFLVRIDMNDIERHME